MVVAQLLKDKKPEITKIWRERVRKHIPAARTINDGVLIDSLPEYLDVIATLIEHSRDDEKTARKRSDICREHAKQRHDLTGYTVEDVMHEYQLLHQVILDVLSAEGPVETEQRHIITESIFNGVRETASIFIKLEFNSRDTALAQARDALKRLNNEQQVREQFVQTLTHDLRQPLTAARASAQLMLRDPSTEMRHSLGVKIISHLDRADAMISNLLDVGAISSGQELKLNIREVNLNALLTRITEDLSTIHGDRILSEIEGQINGYWDEIHLRRAIENLADNAIKYGWHHTPVTIKTSAANGQVLISVHNFGSPIPDGDSTAMFEPFVRSQSAQKGHVKGWGLGLPLTRGIVEAHGGRVTVSSNDKEGTTFTIELPRDSRQTFSETT